jgi:dissimilatory sulfite reductase related protein
MVSKTDTPANPTRDRHLRTVAGHAIYFDWEDFFWDPQDWNEAIALALAAECGMDGLAEIHWRVIRFMRDFYFSQGRAPMNQDLKKGTGLSLMELEALFPQGIRNGARRLAGLPNPKACV